MSTISSNSLFEAERQDNIEKERRKGVVFQFICLAATLFGIAALGVLLVYVSVEAIGWLDWQFITSTPSRFPEQAGIYPALLGSFFVVSLVALFSLPLGVGAAVYLVEYSRKTFLQMLIETNIGNLAGVPSIVYGLLGLGLFVSTLGLPHGVVLVGAFTLTLRVLPIVIVSSQEAIKAVPDLQRKASLALGTTKWQMIRTTVLPEALPGILTGTIIALANAIGETAPLIMVGVATSIFSPPHGLFSSFSAMPLQIFAWSDFPKPEFQHGVVPAAIIVLLVVILSLNGVAIYARNKFYQKRRNI